MRNNGQTSRMEGFAQRVTGLKPLTTCSKAWSSMFQQPLNMCVYDNYLCFVLTSYFLSRMVQPEYWCSLATLRFATLQWASLVKKVIFLPNFVILWRTDTHKKWSFSLKISSVKVTKSAGNCRFGHIYWWNP